MLCTMKSEYSSSCYQQFLVFPLSSHSVQTSDDTSSSAPQENRLIRDQGVGRRPIRVYYGLGQFITGGILWLRPVHTTQAIIYPGVTGQNIPPAGVYPGILWPRPVYTPGNILV